MAGRKNEAVAIEPLRRIRVAAQDLAKQHRANLRAAQRQTEMARGTGMDGINGETAGLVGGLGKQGGIHKGKSWGPPRQLSPAEAPSLKSPAHLTSRDLRKNLQNILAKVSRLRFLSARAATNDPFVYRLGLQIFILARRVRLPYGSPAFSSLRPKRGLFGFKHRHPSNLP